VEDVVATAAALVAAVGDGAVVAVAAAVVAVAAAVVAVAVGGLISAVVGLGVSGGRKFIVVGIQVLWA
jgi:hypothetical protein